MYYKTTKETSDIYSFYQRSILTSCIGKSDSEDDLTLGVKRPISPGHNGTTWTGAGAPKTDEADGFDENYFRRRPKSFYFEGRRFGGDPGVRMSHIADENYLRSMTMVTIFLTIKSLLIPRWQGYQGYPPRGVQMIGYPPPQYHGYSPAIARQEMFLSQVIKWYFWNNGSLCPGCI